MKFFGVSFFFAYFRINFVTVFDRTFIENDDRHVCIIRIKFAKRFSAARLICEFNIAAHAVKFRYELYALDVGEEV